MAASATRAEAQSGRGEGERASAATVKTAGGATAEVDGERLVVRDARGAIVVVYDAERGTAEIVAPGGDLVLSAPAGKIALRAAEIVCEAGRYELNAERVLVRARDVYREIEGLLHTRADRVRTLARDAYQLFAKRLNMAAEEDASVDGKRVLLG
jgi:hypothetical protein